jgi:DNA-binding response OmpR family regulator
MSMSYALPTSLSDDRSRDLVLIADGDLGRGQRVATELEAAGHVCRIAPNGAGALEIALAESPKLIITRKDLPLFDSGKLAEILRANPRTRATRFLFLGAEREAESKGRAFRGIGDEVLPSDAAADEVQQAVARLLERQARVEALEEKTGFEREFDGSLAELGLSDLLETLNERRSTGRLTLAPDLEDGTSPDGWILLEEGEVHSAGSALARGEKALFRMLDWRSGDYLFEPGANDGPVTIKAPTRILLAEGLRQIAEWNRLAAKLPPLESPVKRVAEPGAEPVALQSLSQEILGLIEDGDCVTDVVERSELPDYPVFRALHDLANRGLVEFGRARSLSPESEDTSLFQEAETRRLRHFAGQGLARRSAPPSCKLLVASANERCVEGFFHLLESVPEAELSPRFARGEVGVGDLESIARIHVDEEFGIDLIHLPTRPAHQGIWRFAGHRALGTLFLLGAGEGFSDSELGPVREVLSSDGEARSFHVVMLGEGERVSAKELRGHLSLIDQSSLFLLPTRGGKGTRSLLRSLFGRIAP